MSSHIYIYICCFIIIFFSFSIFFSDYFNNFFPLSINSRLFPCMDFVCFEDRFRFSVLHDDDDDDDDGVWGKGVARYTRGVRPHTCAAQCWGPRPFQVHYRLFRVSNGRGKRQRELTMPGPGGRKGGRRRRRRRKPLRLYLWAHHNGRRHHGLFSINGPAWKKNSYFIHI